MEGRLYANWDSYWKGFMTTPWIENLRFFLVRRAIESLLQKFQCGPQPEFCELGAGTGVVSRYLGEKYGAQVTIVDNNPKALQMCQETFRHYPKKFTALDRDVFDLHNYQRQFDLVHSGGLIEHFVGPARAGIIQAHCDLVKEKGFILILVPVLNLWYRILNKGILKWLHLLDEIKEIPWTFEELETALKTQGFQIIAKTPLLTELGVLAKRV